MSQAKTKTKARKRNASKTRRSGFFYGFTHALAFGPPVMVVGSSSGFERDFEQLNSDWEQVSSDLDTAQKRSSDELGLELIE